MRKETTRAEAFTAHRRGDLVKAERLYNELLRDCIGREQYVEKAVALATTPTELAAVKDRLRSARQTGGFFDTQAFVHSLEEALQTTWIRHMAGQPPADIFVSDSLKS